MGTKRCLRIWWIRQGTEVNVGVDSELKVALKVTDNFHCTFMPKKRVDMSDDDVANSDTTEDVSHRAKLEAGVKPETRERDASTPMFGHPVSAVAVSSMFLGGAQPVGDAPIWPADSSAHRSGRLASFEQPLKQSRSHRKPSPDMSTMEKQLIDVKTEIAKYRRMDAGMIGVDSDPSDCGTAAVGSSGGGALGTAQAAFKVEFAEAKKLEDAEEGLVEASRVAAASKRAAALAKHKRDCEAEVAEYEAACEAELAAAAAAGAAGEEGGQDDEEEDDEEEEEGGQDE